MNRPSRTDDDFDHPTWNQNPPFLAPDLTTCQDLNGIANARELKSSGLPGGLGCAMDEKAVLLGTLWANAGEPGWLRSQRAGEEAGWSSTIRTIGTIICGMVLTIPIRTLFDTLKDDNPKLEPAVRPTAPRPALSKRDGCESGGVDPREYNTPLHVGALLIILFVSSTACAFPMLAKKFPILRIPENFFFAVRHFGTGVLIATAFVHLLPTAFISLGDPCLSGFWTSDYPAMPGAIALAGIFFVAIIEMVFNPARYFPHCAPSPAVVRSSSVVAAPAGDRPLQHEADEDRVEEIPVTRLERGVVHGRRGSISRQLSRLSVVGQADAPREQEPKTERPGKRTASPPDYSSQADMADLSPEQRHKKQILQCMLLEVGILFHSVFIGMALSVAVGTNFIVLLVAIAFHQTFEGMALGARIAAIDWPKHSYRPWLMDLAYGLTTPIGQAIGLATHTLYNPNSSFGLVLVGTMNAISSGLLVYASLVELLSEDLLSDESWRVLRGKKRIAACLLVFAGAFCMSLVGAWA